MFSRVVCENVQTNNNNWAKLPITSIFIVHNTSQFHKELK